MSFSLESRRWMLVTGMAVAALLCRVSHAAPKVDFNRQIRPILSDTCYKCHGPDEKERQGGLRLDMKESALGTLESGGVAIVPGKSAASALVSRILSADPKEKMPPPDSGKTLSPAQIELLKRWIDEGAEFRGHWAFVAPVRPAPPAVQHPAQNPIDHFVLARLEAEGLAPSPMADRVTLIRRATFDLTGLPPTPAEVDAFLADNAADAYERLLNRLFKSPRYGENMARHWLDVARYGDTHGLHLDNERALWPYRDWVIRSFNAHQRFDRFTIEQLAGDLLPNATVEQKLATGFNRCNVTTSEGGSINDEVLVRYAVDRTVTMATVFMGMTATCSVCHDHKYDPLSQKEFYRLYAFFNASADAAMDGNALAPPPILKVELPEQIEKRAHFDAQLAAVRKEIEAKLAGLTYTEPAAAAAPTAEPQEIVWIEDDLPAGAKAEGNPPGWQWVQAPEPVHSGKRSQIRKAPGLSQHFFTGASQGLTVGAGDKLFCYVYLDPLELPKEIMVQFNDGSWEHRAYWGEDAIPWGQAGTASRVAMGPLPETGKWVRLEVEAQKVGLQPGAVINGWAFTQFDGTVRWDKAGIVTRTPQDGAKFESLLAWQAAVKADAKTQAPKPIVDAIKLEPEKRNEAQQKQIRDYFLERVYPKTKDQFAPLHAKEAEWTKQKADLEAAIPVSLVMQDLPQPRDTFVLIRGAYDKRGEKVTAGVPAVFPPLPEGAPLNRLGLAQWLVAPSHPLTARVTVNRLWQQFFGQGIVKTAEDFGSQGEWPTHPELLDWLATEFVESGWNVQHVQRLLLTSAAYRQTSRVTPELVKRDPENNLLARGPRFRLDAEALRDAALAASGLLVERIGGKSVKPYQPEGLWQAVGFVGSNTREYKVDSGEALYRRSLYTFWKRTSPPPSMSTFDAPSRETCVARRPRTNTPLQALALMNDEQYVEAARAFAERLFREGGGSAEERLTHGFRLATARRPEPAELAVLSAVLAKHLAHYQAAPEEATKLLAIGAAKRNEQLPPAEHAAWTMLANLLLNLDEAITKE